jgi:hypothetical protein
MTSRPWRLLAGLLLLAACDDMSNQEKVESYEPSELFADGSGIRPPPEGSVARDEPDRDAPTPARVDLPLPRRGEERYGIYCTPCHGRVGDGRGMIVARGFPQPSSFHIERLRAAPARHIYDVITHGYGAMYAYGMRVIPADRWAIAAHIRSLQLSQNAAVAALPEEDRQQLERQAP